MQGFCKTKAGASVRRRTGFAALGLAFSTLLCALAPRPAFAFPDRPVRLIIPLPPGGIADIVARVMQPHLEKSFAQPIIIENRPGASGIVGANAVHNAPADGHTLLFVTTTFSINAALKPSVQYLRALEPVSILAQNSLLFLVNPNVKAKSLKEFVALAKTQKMFYGTPGIASQAHLLLEAWSGQAGIQMQHVPYQGGPPAVLAAVNGEVDLTLISPAASLPQITHGALRALATSASTREKELPDVPTAAEAGFPNFHARQWIGLVTTPGTPQPIIEQLNRAFQEVLQREDVKEVMLKQGMTPGRGGPQELRQLLDTEIKQWTEVAKTAKITVD
ncbi:MAG: transporter [Hyphomicrobiales bacterium]|nr:transporter [Hyphomicrobiales bacterium]